MVRFLQASHASPCSLPEPTSLSNSHLDVQCAVRNFFDLARDTVTDKLDRILGPVYDGNSYPLLTILHW